MNYLTNYNYWLTDDYFDENTKNELKAISDNDNEIKERFYKDLEFGTGGLRGIMGAGTNRMNIYTVRKATQGLANYLKKSEAKGAISAVIAHDCRNLSPEFTIEAALVLCGNGIKTYLFDELRSTPELSFAVRHLKCTTGIVITASHNPPEYNGYKAFGYDGGQVTYPTDEEIVDEVGKVTDFSQIKIADKDEAIKSGLLVYLNDEVDNAFIQNAKSKAINTEKVKEAADSLSIVYTPFNGAGNKLVRRILKETGFNNVHVVPEQELPDGNFPTVAFPNPEDPNAFKLAIGLAEKVSADIIIGTDPDADRTGAMIKKPGGGYMVLTGNMIGSLLTEYILSEKSAAGALPANPAVISTIVSTRITAEIAKKYGADYFDVLTGFKYIGEKILQFKETGSNEYVFGFEESNGFSAGDYTRDKDSIVTSMLLCELAAFCKANNSTVYDRLMRIYKEYGYYKEETNSATFKGLEGIEDIKRIMAGLRENPPEAVAGKKVVEICDYKNSLRKRDGQTTKLTLPVSDVLYYLLEGGDWFCVRPSGTEPKVKIYFGVKRECEQEASSCLKEIMSEVMGLLQ